MKTAPLGGHILRAGCVTQAAMNGHLTIMDVSKTAANGTSEAWSAPKNARFEERVFSK
ncbi:MAG: hypothetical protein ACLP07_11520 [Terracidiphilus sp.]